MRNIFYTLIGLFVSTSALAQTTEGLVTVASPHSATQTMARLEAAVKERNLNIFAKIDHAAGAAKINKTLRPT
jgi:uncharacterized protein (DUF302 family)